MNYNLILGTAQFGLDYGINNSSGMPSLEKVLSILCLAKNRIMCLDTANEYGLSEQRIGQYHKDNPNHKFEINTKFSKGIINDPLEEITTSIEKLQVPIINTIMFHSLDDFYQNRENTKLLLKKGRGKFFKKFGVSVYDVKELEQLKNIDEVEVIQVSFNLLDNHCKKGNILNELKNLDKEIHVRSCFLQGLFFRSPESLNGNLKDATKYLNEIHSIIRDKKISLGQLALSYCISKPYIDKVLIGVDSTIQLKQNIKWASEKLSKEIEHKIDKIDVKEELLLNPSKW